MPERWNFLHSRFPSVVIASVLLAIVGVIDYAVTPDWHVGPLYVLPVAGAAWGAGLRWGICVAVLASGIWLVAELANGAPEGRAAIPYWNALMFLVVVFLSVVVVVSALRRMVKERTEQLRAEMTRRHEAELARLRAERLAVVGTMAAQLAHEVRNPMSSISLNLELLSDEVRTLSANGSHSPKEAAVLLSQIEQEIQRINSVISDYLGFARLPKIVLQPVSFQAFLDEKLALSAAELAAARVRLVKKYDPHIGFIHVDASQLWQVILNLLRNAKEAMPDGGELTVRTRRQDGEIRIDVSDTGNGISQEDAARIFTPFFTTKVHGTGLGLALSQRIVAEHGGRLDFHSAPGIGATFTILLPLARRRAASDPIGFNPEKTKPPAIHELHTAGSC